VDLAKGPARQQGAVMEEGLALPVRLSSSVLELGSAAGFGPERR